MLDTDHLVAALRARDERALTQLYDRYLVAVGDAQKGLAERALRGERRALGTVVQTAALKHALDLD